MCNSFFKIFLKKIFAWANTRLILEIEWDFFYEIGCKAGKKLPVFFRRGCQSINRSADSLPPSAFIFLWRDSSLLRGSWGGASLRNRSPLPWCSNCARVCSNLFCRARIRAHACSKVEHAKSRTKVRLFFVFRICIYVYIIIWFRWKRRGFWRSSSLRKPLWALS